MVELLFILLVILVLARVSGELAERLGQPSILGELMAGVILGLFVTYFPGVLPPLTDISSDEAFLTLGNMGILFLMLMAGTEINPKELAQSSKIGILVAIGGVVAPFALGYLLAQHFLPDSQYKFAQSIFLGTALSITDVPVSVRVLMSMNRLNTKLGHTIVSAAVIDDIIGLILLAVVTATLKYGKMPSVIDMAILLGKVAGFILFAVFANSLLVRRLLSKFVRMRSVELDFSLVLALALANGGLAQLAGLHFAVGAFLTGVFIPKSIVNGKDFSSIGPRLSAVTLGFLVPFFFVSFGLATDFSVIGVMPLFMGLVILAALIGKLVGCGFIAKLTGFSMRDSLSIGWAMNGRGTVGLVVVEVALGAGLFDHPVPVPIIVKMLYPAVIVMALVTTIVTPIGLRFFLKNHRQQ